jgi:hypothetical protein
MNYATTGGFRSVDAFGSPQLHTQSRFDRPMLLRCYAFVQTSELLLGEMFV